MSETIRIDRNVYIPMRDGIRLSGEIYRPGDDGQYPAIVIRTPYDINEVLDFSYIRVLPTIRAGYALVISYVRGRFSSEGEYDSTAPQAVEGPDSYDTIEWVAAQPWCDGNIGMAGESGLGTVQWKAARENPPHLKAIAPSLAGIPGERGPEVSDAPVLLNVAVSFLSLVAGDVIEKLEDKGEDVSELRRLFDEVKNDPSKAYNYLPLKDVPQFNIPGVKEIWMNLLGITSTEGQTGGTEPYPYHEVQIPTLNVAGWYDPWSRLTFYTYQNIRDKAGSSYAREHQHLFVGPWCHHKPTRILGDIDFGPLAGENGSRAWGYQLAFFDKYLKGKDIDIPEVRYFTMGENAWKDAGAWPLPQTDWQRFYLHSGGNANSGAGDGFLSADVPGKELPDTYVYDPSFPVPTTGGKGAEAENGFVSGPIDQVHIEARKDVLCYTSSTLGKDMEITGPLELHMFVSTSCADTDFSAKLVDLYPDGKAYNIADGITRVKHRNSFDKAELVEPGEIFEILIRLGPISQLFKRGHNIRLDITSSDFPAFDRNMNTGNPTGVDSEGIPVSQAIYHQTEYASYIDLPIIPD